MVEKPQFVMLKRHRGIFKFFFKILQAWTDEFHNVVPWHLQFGYQIGFFWSKSTNAIFQRYIF